MNPSFPAKFSLHTQCGSPQPSVQGTAREYTPSRDPSLTSRPAFYVSLESSPFGTLGLISSDSF